MSLGTKASGAKGAPVARGEAVLLASRGEGARTRKPLKECVRDALADYFTHLDGHATTGLYRMVMAEVEAPLLETVMRYTRDNQSKAADLLGINRATLRKKLKQYHLD